MLVNQSPMSYTWIEIAAIHLESPLPMCCSIPGCWIFSILWGVFLQASQQMHYPLYGTSCTRLSSPIFEWNEADIGQLRKARREQLKKPTEKQVSANISTAELAKQCKKPLDAMWDLTDTTGLRLINADSMRHIWEDKQKHLPCIPDVPGLELYTKVVTARKGLCGHCLTTIEALEAAIINPITLYIGWMEYR